MNKYKDAVKEGKRVIRKIEHKVQQHLVGAVMEADVEIRLAESSPRSIHTICSMLNHYTHRSNLIAL